MNSASIPFLTAAALGRLMRRQEISPVEAVEAYLERIYSVDRKLNSYITVSRDHALAAARQAESEIAAGEYRGPLHGVPVAVKDQFNTAGILTTGGLQSPGNQRTRLRRHRHIQSQERRRHPDWQAEHERVRHWEQRLPPLGHAPQSLGSSEKPRHLQQWFRRRHRRLPLRHLSGRGHRRLHSQPRQQLRPRRPSPHMGAGQSLRNVGRLLVKRHRRPDLSHRRRLRPHPAGHRRPRPQ